MASSDDEGETYPDAIMDYVFYDKDNDPISFSKLPVQWNDNESSSANTGPVYLSGLVDNGRRKIYQQVIAWKYDMLTTVPQISVLFKDNHWIKLEKPKKCYKNMIRTIFVSVHCLCYLKRKPEAPEKSLWNHLSKVFSSYDVNPSVNDLIDHISFIREAVKRDETLEKSKFLAAFLDNPRKRKSHDENVGTATKPSFIVDDTNAETQDDDIITNQTKDSESDEEDDNYDTVCAICDNGGALICCDGECFRSFHATRDSGLDSKCKSLGLTSKELEGLQNQLYKCENCKYRLHQCFVCGKLGSSDKSSNTEVYRCCSATCGHFYHPECVAKLLQRNDKAGQQALKEKIAAGEPFVCPAHKCAVCKQTENEKVKDLQFATCRRCPKSYHRKCLPSDIMFYDQIGGGGDDDDDHGGDDDDDDDDVVVEARAWNGLLPKSRALIYCLEHEIVPKLGTPARPIIFEIIRDRKTPQPDKKKVAVKLTDLDSENPSKKSVLKSQKHVEKSSTIKSEGSSKKRAAFSSCEESLKRKKVANTSRNPLRNLSTKVKKPSSNDGQPTLGSRLFDLFDESHETISNNLEKDDTSAVAKSQQTEILPPLDDKSKERLLALMKEAASSVTLDEVKKYHQEKVPSTHALSSRVDKTIYLARVEGAVKAINLAAKKLKDGCSVEDVKAVCDPGVFDQLMRWKDRLGVYLAPFLHGMRYTSYGRHFTKVDKLEKIADKLQWYVEDGDMVVDFCCGANDFSCLMKKRLDEMGKTNCSYKNYDFKQPKNDFNFEKRDWMKVSPKELPNGSRLIMGLNPPFGMNASLANKFIANALLFKPKLIILIVPPETQRLDSERRRPQYDLIWEDASLLAGKSFYFPGSADVNGNQVDQWNNTTPPLYLWSRPDWTYKHKSIAQQHGHIPRVQTPRQSDQNGPALDLPVGNYDQGASNQTHAQGLTRYGSTNGTPHNRTNTSATQRYAPRLDELNNVRVNNSGRSGLQEMNSARISGVGQHEPPVGSRGVGGYGPPVNGPGSHMGSLGFAPGPDHQYSQHTSSGGWLDD
ncbi:protein ENHANCED DOWNY MILDEW 2 isoform X2 [Helianthus annuus]|uniref:protein ENHANCED DOWNY MILDEW 2 isoform X2 n=1 Tax=Helianthus annuus TaxID=4232 RepID=UPI000B8FE246|nr:protein ENHANCED DOWNY MILDEW 2 isoform X2 [Helianthus annuus]